MIALADNFLPAHFHPRRDGSRVLHNRLGMRMLRVHKI